MTELKNRISRAGGLCPVSAVPDLAAVVSVALAVAARAGRESREAQVAAAAAILNCMKMRRRNCPALDSSGRCTRAVWRDAEEASARADFGDRDFVRALAIVCELIAGEIDDPTDGATHWHAHTEMPGWARHARPSALIGPNFYYRFGPRRTAQGGTARGDEQHRL